MNRQTDIPVVSTHSFWRYPHGFDRFGFSVGNDLDLFYQTSLVDFGKFDHLADLAVCRGKEYHLVLSSLTLHKVHRDVRPSEQQSVRELGTAY